MKAKLRALASVVALTGATGLSACAQADDAHSEGGDEAQSVTTLSTSAMPTSTTTLTSGDPLYDRWAAALTKAGIDYAPGVWGTYSSDQSVCDGLRRGDIDAFQLAGREQVAARTEDGRRIEIMITILCPDQQAVLDEARRPNPTQRTSLSGKMFVRIAYDPTGPVIQPGTWRTGQVSDCYWERLDDQGNIIENNFVSISKSVVVTILPSDSAFNARNCGRWTRVE